MSLIFHLIYTQIAKVMTHQFFLNVCPHFNENSLFNISVKRLKFSRYYVLYIHISIFYLFKIFTLGGQQDPRIVLIA